MIYYYIGWLRCSLSRQSCHAIFLNCNVQVSDLVKYCVQYIFDFFIKRCFDGFVALLQYSKINGLKHTSIFRLLLWHAICLISLCCVRDRQGSHQIFDWVSTLMFTLLFWDRNLSWRHWKTQCTSAFQLSCRTSPLAATDSLPLLPTCLDALHVWWTTADSLSNSHMPR